MIATKAEGADQALPADRTRYYAGGGDRLGGLVRCARPGCRAIARLDVASISREIKHPDAGYRGRLLLKLAMRALERAVPPRGWMRLEWGTQRFDLCSWSCLRQLSEHLT